MNNIKNIRTVACETLVLEKETIGGLIPTLNEEFDDIVHLIHKCSGKVILTGVGKSAIIGQKIAATFNSTGTVASFLHAGDAIHGDLGIIEQEDIIICISKSGHTAEIKIILNIIQEFGNKIIGMSAAKDSYLHQNSDYFIWTPVDREADPNNLAPTCSTIAQLAMGDALAVCLAYLKNFQKQDFVRNHPGGMLGKLLRMKVRHLLHLHEKPVVRPDQGIDQIILEMTAKRLGATAVLDSKQEIVGIITDGDLRRMLIKHSFSRAIKARDIMTSEPVIIQAERGAHEAMDMMKENSITQLIVTDNGQYTGMIHLHDLLKEGF